MQLAASTQAKPSPRRIVPGPRKPAPPGRAAFARRHARGRNQTAQTPNQPETTVCMLERETEEGAPTQRGEFNRSGAVWTMHGAPCSMLGGDKAQHRAVRVDDQERVRRGP